MLLKSKNIILWVSVVFFYFGWPCLSSELQQDSRRTRPNLVFWLQVHRFGNEVKYYSRRAIEHGEASSFNILDPIILRQVKQENVILDGELLVWNTARYGLKKNRL